MDSSQEFDGQRKKDENYAYMLLSNAGSMSVPVKNLTTLTLDLDVSINEVRLKNDEAYDDTMHDAQCVFYLYLEDSVSGEKMNLCLFVYDHKQSARWIGNYNWEDPDTGAYVYSLDTRELYDYDIRRHRDIDTDLISYLMAAFRSARNNGYMLRSFYANLVITGVSFGWQNPGAFSCEAVLKRFDLVAYENGTETELITDYPPVTVNTTKDTGKPVHEFVKDLTKQHELGVSGIWVPYEIGTLNYGVRAKEGRVWQLVQTGSRFSLLDSDVKFSSPGEGIYRYTDESKMVLVNTNDGSFELALDGRVEWPDRVRGVEGVHYILEFSVEVPYTITELYPGKIVHYDHQTGDSQRDEMNTNYAISMGEAGAAYSAYSTADGCHVKLILTDAEGRTDGEPSGTMPVTGEESEQYIDPESEAPAPDNPFINPVIETSDSGDKNTRDTNTLIHVTAAAIAIVVIVIIVVVITKRSNK